MAETRSDLESLFAESNLVGPEDRPRGDWEISVYEWRAVAPAIVKDYMDEMDGTAIRAVQAAVQAEEGRIYLRACDPSAPKAQPVSLSPTHRSANFSLFTQLLSLNFPRVNKNHKAVFRCRPETIDGVKILVIEVKGYWVEKVDRVTKEEAAAATQQESAAAGLAPQTGQN